MHRRKFLQIAALALATSVVSACSRPEETEPSGGAGTGKKALVIGAGISGLAAANRLRQQGFVVQVIEGNERIGGRIWTSRVWPDAPVDLGASWIHGVDGNPIAELAAQAGATLIPTSYESSVTYGSDGEELDAAAQAELDALSEQITDLLSAGQDAETDQSILATVETGLSWQTLTPAQQSLARFILTSTIETEYSGASDETSTYWYDSGEEFGGDDALFAQGYTIIVEALAEGLPITTGAPVRSVVLKEDGVQVQSDAETFNADYVVCTIPLGVLQAGAINFDPALPAQQQAAIDELGMGLLDKVYLRFSEVFWDADFDWLEYIPADDSNWAEWVSLARPTGQPILLGFAAADFARQMEALSDDQIIASAMTTLKTIFGDAVPPPESSQITRWAADPFARGSYSYYALGSEPSMREDLASPVADRIFFAGEATSVDHPGTVHGAYLSGLYAAELVAGT